MQPEPLQVHLHAAPLTPIDWSPDRRDQHLLLRPHCVAGVAGFLSGTGRVPTRSATEKEKAVNLSYE